MLSTLLEIILTEDLFRVQVPNYGLILESKPRAFVNHISSVQAPDGMCQANSKVTLEMPCLGR